MSTESDQLQVTLIADIVHVIEYIWDAARALFGGSNSKAERWVSDRLLALLSGRSGGDVAKTIRWEARTKDLDARAQATIRKTCTYLADRSRTRMLGYQEALRDGLPIATGVIEGACRHVVEHRMDRTGARWSLTGAEAVLRRQAPPQEGQVTEIAPFQAAAKEPHPRTASQYPP